MRSLTRLQEHGPQVPGHSLEQPVPTLECVIRTMGMGCRLGVCELPSPLF